MNKTRLATVSVVALSALSVGACSTGHTATHSTVKPAAQQAAPVVKHPVPKSSPSPTHTKQSVTAHELHKAHEARHAARESQSANPVYSRNTTSSRTGGSCHTLTYTSSGPITSPGHYNSSGTCIAPHGPVHQHFTYSNASTVKRPASSGEVQMCNVDPAQAKAEGISCP